MWRTTLIKIKKWHLCSAQSSAKVEKQTGLPSGTKRSLNPIKTTDTTVPGRIIFPSVYLALSPVLSLCLWLLLGRHPWTWRSYLLPSSLLSASEYELFHQFFYFFFKSLSLFSALPSLRSSSPLLIRSTPPNGSPHSDQTEGQFEAMLRAAVWVFIAFIIQMHRRRDYCALRVCSFEIFITGENEMVGLVMWRWILLLSLARSLCTHACRQRCVRLSKRQRNSCSQRFSFSFAQNKIRFNSRNFN